MQNTVVKVRTEVKYGRKINYPANQNAERFCDLVSRYGTKDEPAKSLTDRQLKIIENLGFTVEASKTATGAKNPISDEKRQQIKAAQGSMRSIAKQFGVSAFAVTYIKREPD